jgi:hypothetical protein
VPDLPFEIETGNIAASGEIFIELMAALSRVRFVGEPVGAGEEWAARYRSDMEKVARLLSECCALSRMPFAGLRTER